MKTPEEIKKGLEYCTSDRMSDCDKCPYAGRPCNDMDLLTDALAYIRQLEAQNAELVRKADELAAQVPRWISIEKRKPKRGEYVLFLYAKDAQNPVMHAKNPMVVGRYDYGMYLANGCEVKVTHWMPLPELPKE